MSAAPLIRRAIDCGTFPEAAAVIAELVPLVLARVTAIYAIQSTWDNMLGSIVDGGVNHFTSAEIKCLGFTEEDASADDNALLWDACSSGYLDVAKWLVAAFGLRPADAVNDDIYALSIACENGHLEVAQWLWSFGPDMRAVDADHCQEVYAACEHGHLAVVKWLVGIFHLTADPAFDALAAVRDARRHGHVAVVRYLKLGGSCAPP